MVSKKFTHYLEDHERRYYKWALYNTRDGFLLGRFCYSDGNSEDLEIRLFRTREQARRAKKAILKSYKECSKPVKVRVTLTPVF